MEGRDGGQGWKGGNTGRRGTSEEGHVICRDAAVKEGRDGGH